VLAGNRQRLVVFEGPDGTGKTSIAQEVSRLTGVPYFKNEDEHTHFLSNPDYFLHAIRYVAPYFTKYLRDTGSSVILDRAWPSEWVYSRVLDRQTDMKAIEWLDRTNAELGTRVVLTYKTSYDSIDDYPVIVDRIKQIDRTYAEFATWTHCRVMRLCVDDMNLQAQTDSVISFMTAE
jgi:thymidylate kinase